MSNSHKCLIYNSENCFVGKYDCLYTETKEETNEIEEVSIARKNIIELKILNVELCESFNNYRLMILIELPEKYLKLDNKYLVVSSDKIENDIIIHEEKENFGEFILIDVNEYNKLINNIDETVIDWSNIKNPSPRETLTKPKIFEKLCEEIISDIRCPLSGSYIPTGSGDQGRDYTWEWPNVETQNTLLNLPTQKWIMQCKYTNSNLKLYKTEIWDGIVAVLEHEFDHYLLVTNRELTPDTYNWWEQIKNTSNRRKSCIPMSCFLITKIDLENYLRAHDEIRRRYF